MGVSLEGGNRKKRSFNPGKRYNKEGQTESRQAERKIKGKKGAVEKRGIRGRGKSTRNGEEKKKKAMGSQVLRQRLCKNLTGEEGNWG